MKKLVLSALLFISAAVFAKDSTGEAKDHKNQKKENPKDHKEGKKENPKENKADKHENRQEKKENKKDK